MTSTERKHQATISRYRARIDVLTDQRDYARARVPVPRPVPRCVYCSAATARRSDLACEAHVDLLVLDPFFAMAETRAA